MFINIQILRISNFNNIKFSKPTYYIGVWDTADIETYYLEGPFSTMHQLQKAVRTHFPSGKLNVCILKYLYKFNESFRRLIRHKSAIMFDTQVYSYSEYTKLFAQVDAIMYRH